MDFACGAAFTRGGNTCLMRFLVSKSGNYGTAHELELEVDSRYENEGRSVDMHPDQKAIGNETIA